MIFKKNLKLSYWLKVLLTNILVIGVFLFDRILKHISLSNKNFFPNRNFLFGYLYLSNFVLILLFPLLFLFFYFLAKAYSQKKIFQVFFWSLFILGALSNMLDRLIYGFVIDYISLPFWGKFNLGDTMLYLALFLGFIHFLKNK